MTSPKYDVDAVNALLDQAVDLTNGEVEGFIGLPPGCSMIVFQPDGQFDVLMHNEGAKGAEQVKFLNFILNDKCCDSLIAELKKVEAQHEKAAATSPGFVSLIESAEALIKALESATQVLSPNPEGKPDGPLH